MDDVLPPKLNKVHCSFHPLGYTCREFERCAENKGCKTAFLEIMPGVEGLKITGEITFGLHP
jgi:hypothetical protein